MPINHRPHLIARHLFLYPELLSRLVFVRADDGSYQVQAQTTPPQQFRWARPEEIIRQIFLLSLIHHYRYPAERIRLEYLVLMGRERKRADLVVLNEEDSVSLVIEVKQQIDDDAIHQLKSYVWATGATNGAVVSGHELVCFKRASNNIIEITDLPMFGGIASDSDITTQPETNVSIPPSPKQVFAIDKFERLSQTKTRISIKGVSQDFENEDLARYRKVQQRYISVGIVIGAKINQDEWLAFIESKFDQVGLPPVAAPVDKETMILKHVAEFINLHGDSKFADCDDAASWRKAVHNQAGWSRVNRITNKREYLFTPAGMRDCLRAFDFRTAIEILRRHGALAKKDASGRSARLTSVAGKIIRVYRITPSTLSAYESSEENSEAPTDNSLLASKP